TRASRASVSRAAERAAVTASAVRGNPGARARTVTGRASLSSVAFQTDHPGPAPTRSSSWYRPPSRVPAPAVRASGTTLIPVPSALGHLIQHATTHYRPHPPTGVISSVPPGTVLAVPRIRVPARSIADGRAASIET